MERSFLMIKPEVVENGKQGEIIDLLIKNRFTILRMRQFRFDESGARLFYSIHEGKPFFDALIKYIISGSVIGIELEMERAIELLRELVGATDPAGAGMGTVRYIYGTSLRRNAVHASDSPESVEKELAIVFPED